MAETTTRNLDSPARTRRASLSPMDESPNKKRRTVLAEQQTAAAGASHLPLKASPPRSYQYQAPPAAAVAAAAKKAASRARPPMKASYDANSPSLSFASLVDAACAEADGLVPGECPSPISVYSALPPPPPAPPASSAAAGGSQTNTSSQGGGATNGYPHAVAFGPVHGGLALFTERDIAMERRLRECIRLELERVKASPGRNTSVVAKGLLHLGAFYYLRGCTYQGGRYVRKAWSIYRRYCRAQSKDVREGAAKFVANLQALGCAELWANYCVNHGVGEPSK